MSAQSTHMLMLPLSREAQIEAASRGEPAATPARYEIPPELVPRLAALPWAEVADDGTIRCSVRLSVGYPCDPLDAICWSSTHNWGAARTNPPATRPATPEAAIAEAERIAADLRQQVEARVAACREAVRAWAAMPVAQREDPAFLQVGNLRALAKQLVPEAVAEYEEDGKRRQAEKREAEARREAERAAAEAAAIEAALVEIEAREPEQAAHLRALLAEGFRSAATRQAQTLLLRLRTPEGWGELEKLVAGATSVEERERTMITPAELAAYREAEAAAWPHVSGLDLVWAVWFNEEGEVVEKGPTLVATVKAPTLGPHLARSRRIGRRL